MSQGLKELSHSKENVTGASIKEWSPAPKLRDRFGQTTDSNEDECYRSYLRIPIVTTAHVTSRGHHITAKVIVRDISIDGMGGYTICPYQKGEVIRVKLKFTLPQNRVVEESILAEVRWATKVDQREKVFFGFRFYDVQEKNPKLFTYLKELEDHFLTA